MLNTPWDKDYNQVLIRNSPTHGDFPYVLEFGVNYFILKLESMGLKTYWSCEGHPTDFYVIFSSPYKIARKIAYASINSSQISIIHGIKNWEKKSKKIIFFKSPWWRMNLLPDGHSYEYRNQILRNLSMDWEKFL